MYECIRCPTCNDLLGDIYIPFQQLRKIKMEMKKEEKKKLPTKESIITQEDCLDIFELLHVTNLCCKTRLNMIKTFNDTVYEDYNE
jgi:DNA-directed RNA polymerase subunit N (RpoN/RPB10)